MLVGCYHCLTIYEPLIIENVKYVDVKKANNTSIQLINVWIYRLLWHDFIEVVEVVPSLFSLYTYC